MISYNAHVVSSVISIGIGSLLYGYAISKDIVENLNVIKESPKNKQTVSHGVAQLVDFIQIHSMTKQLSKIMNCESFFQSIQFK